MNDVLRLVVRAPHQPALRRQALKVSRLDDVTPKRRKEVVRFFGLPPGFVVDSYAGPVYLDGQEVATNLSANRVEITRDDDHRYLILRYMHLHPGANRSAQVAADL